MNARGGIRWASLAAVPIALVPIALAVVVVALAALTLACGGMPPPPSRFYTPDARPGGEPGAIVRSEEMKGSPPGSKAWRVLYASTGLHGERIEVSGVIIAPELPPPQGGRPVIAWAHPTTGVADACAPSTNPEFFDTIPHLPALIALDYVVAATDYAGLGTPGPHPYLVGESEGRSVLDAVRAAANLPKTGAGPRFIAWGHSQGGHAALFAGQLAGRYAPDLALVGVAAIAPATELRELLQDDFSERAGRVLTAYALWSWAEVFDAPLESAAHPAAIPGIERIARDCVETEGEGYRVALRLARHGRFLPDPGRARRGALEASARPEPAGRGAASARRSTSPRARTTRSCVRR